jgi:hypothetical protein
MSACHRDMLSSLSTADLLKPLGHCSHYREGVNGNSVLVLGCFSLLERLAYSLVRSVASPLTTRGFPLAKVQAPTVGCSTAHGLLSRSRCRRSYTYLGFVLLHYSPCQFSGLARPLPSPAGSRNSSRAFLSYLGWDEFRAHLPHFTVTSPQLEAPGG